MTQRTIVHVERGDRSSTLRLVCGHDRSIGGHQFHDGTAITPRMVGKSYDCQDGHCCTPQRAF